MKVTKEQLIEIVEKSNATSLIVSSRGEAKMTKTNNPFYTKEGRSWIPLNEVIKESVVEYDFGGDYEDRVNEALVADGSAGTFKASGLTWGEWKVFGKTISHNGKTYLRVYVNRNNEPQTKYFVDGVAATESQIADIKAFTPVKTESAKQLNEGLSAEKQIIPNAIDFDRIVSIDISGVLYEL